MNSQNVEYLILRRYAEQEKQSAEGTVRAPGGDQAAPIRGVHVPARGLRDGLFQGRCRSDSHSFVPGLTVSLRPMWWMCVSTRLQVEEDPLTIVYQGGMDWFPNRDALEYFVRQIFPLVQKEVPDARLIAAGRNPAPEFRAQFDDVKALGVHRHATRSSARDRQGSGDGHPVKDRQWHPLEDTRRAAP